jgi:hypothetical protein
VALGISRAGTFAFSFSLPVEKDTPAGNLSTDGSVISGAWKSVTTTGTKGNGQLTATRV